ncbi:MAG TPA: ABC transporter permease [Stellaceae bacterium]|nr:ABC transporter permease [Stellaceae bacterium]
MRWRKHLDRLVVLVVLVALWQVASYILGSYWVSSPWEVTSRFFASLWSGELIRQSGYTIEESFVGAVVGGVPAVVLPFLLRRSPIMTAILDPFMVGGYGAPKLALAPLFILWFGIGTESKIALVASVLFFVVYFTTLSGVRALDAKLVQMAQVMGASEHQVARHIVFPAAIPNIFAGFRIGLPYAIGAAVIAELISSNRGLGYLVQVGAMNFDTTQCFVAIAAATLIVHAAGWMVDATERLLLRWRPAGDSLVPASGN